MTDQHLTQPTADLEQRIRIYEKMDQDPDWPGALQAIDYTIITLLTLGLVVTFYLWGF
ncbi:hypothetical protein [Shewanella sp.]|uniref:hypothetical protein n=1 Tax=Shewanella sp. TaxID=50422 RepID=UPI001ED07B78|nr:hypothetical protein [Shewanella sp.]NRB24233.1 hypothetical protein [Shewanella sp.]